MTVDTRHPEYARFLETWQRVRAACEGARAIKAGKTAFLPKPTSDVADTEIQMANDHRYRQYIERAVYTNFCGRTLTGLKGAAFKRDPEVNLPTGLAYLEDNATGDGTGLVQLAKDGLTEVLSVGRMGYLTDYPTVEEGLSAEQTAGLEARILPYTAENIINWKTATASSRTFLVLLVLKEKYNEADDEFSHAGKDQFRVLRIQDGQYTQQVYRDGDSISAPVVIKDAGGKNFESIPFVFVGSLNNDFTVDNPPMEAMAEVNIAHYRNSADIEENSFIHGQLTLGVTSSLSADQWKQMNPAGIVVGSRAGHFLGDSGGFHSVQANASSLTKELMKEKENQLVMLGAQLITDKNANQTAKAAQIQHASEHSVLGDVVGNLSEAIEACIAWCGMFMGVAGEAEFKINTQFFDEGVDPQLLMAAIQLYDREVIAGPDLQDYTRKAGILAEDRTNEDVDADLEVEDPVIIEDAA